MTINPLICNCFIDSCAFDPKYKPEDDASNEIFGLCEDGKLLIQIAHSTQKEIKHPNTPAWVKREASNLIYTIAVSLTDNENKLLRKIETILAGNGKVESILQDARHIFEAQKYGSYFITTDFRLLSRAANLRSSCNVVVLTPSEFLSIVKQYLLEIQDNQTKGRSLEKPSMTKKPQEAKIDSVFYKGYRIQAAPYKLTDSGEFKVNISIWRDTGSSVNIRNFSAANTFKTKEEAIAHCINFGQQIINGEFENCSVTDL